MEELIKLLIEIFGEDEVEIRHPSLLEQTVADMLSDDYGRRMNAEYKQLLIRYQRLSLIVRNYDDYKDKIATPLTVLEDQLNCMAKYMQILIGRAALERVDLT